MPPANNLKPDHVMIASPGPITGNLLDGLKEQRAIRQRKVPSLHLWVLVSILGDLIMIVCAEHVAYWLRFHSFIREFGIASTIELQQYSGHMALGSLTLLLALGWQGLYHRNVLLRNRWIASRIARAVLIWTLGFLSFSLALKLEPSISRVYVALNGACSLLMLLGWRSVFDSILHAPGRIETLQQRTLFVGWNDDAQRLWRTLSEDRAHAFNLVGWVDASKWRGDDPIPDNIPFVGYVDNIHRIIAQHEVDMIIVADLPREQMVELANLCEREMIQFKLAPSVFRIFVSGLSLETIAGTPVLGINRLPLDSTLNVMLKRSLDVVGAIIGLIISVPLVAIFGAIVYLESPGSIFYHQRRWGMSGIPFNIIKIRSMKLNAESTGAQWCTQDDPRRLRVGAFMRKYNIDEVPQFWNVLKGEMSLVGPRPERPELIANFKHEIPHYNARHAAKPGMTGWAQIKGLRGDTDLAERIKCDLWYLENWSLMLDLQIMFLTFFKRDNAY
jgi:exopolysaccharide biosynthesis polyprenyl glycosylphosphotransferase